LPEVSGQLDRLNAIVPVSRETFGRLERYVSHLLAWQARINLIGPSTVSEVWQRHITDSVQILALGRTNARWLDIGSGGGLPGIVIGCFLADIKGAHIDLVESNGKKAAFLRFVAGELNLPATIHAARIEAVVETLPQPDFVTARALAPLGDLMGFTNLLLKRGATALFPKGRGFEEELTQAQQSWHFCCRYHKSLTDRGAQILEITMPQP